jgi:hypothetical protein
VLFVSSRRNSADASRWGIDIQAPGSSAYSTYRVDTYRIMAHETFPSSRQLSFIKTGRKEHTLGTALLLIPSRCFHLVDQVE